MGNCSLKVLSTIKPINSPSAQKRKKGHPNNESADGFDWEDSPSNPNPGAGRDNPDQLYHELTSSPTTSMRRLSFQKELRSLQDKKGSSKIFKKMSSTKQIGDIERVHTMNASARDRKKSVDFQKIKYGECKIVGSDIVGLNFFSYPITPAPNPNSGRRGSLDYDSDTNYHELRSLLETSTGQKYLCKFMTLMQEPSAAQFNLLCMYCWIDCASFMEINSRQFRYTRAIQIYDRYVEKSSRTYIQILPEPILELIKESLAELLKYSASALLAAGTDGLSATTDTGKMSIENINKAEFKSVTKHMYDKLSNCAFRHLVSNLLIPFKLSENFVKYQVEMLGEQAMTVGVDYRRRKCKIYTDDFVYYRLLGKGGFARVVHVMKRSTKQVSGKTNIQMSHY